MHINPIEFQNQIINAEKPGKAKIKAGIRIIFPEGNKIKNAIYRTSINQNVRENTNCLISCDLTGSEAPLIMQRIGLK